MNISPVSFGNVDSSARFQEMIAKPQVYTMQNTAVASTPVGEEPKKKGGFLKKAVLTVLALGAVIFGIAYAAKKGKFEVKPESGNKVVNTVKSALGKVGNTVNDFVAKHSDDIQKAKDAVQDSAEKVTQKAPQA